ncbi:MAG: isoprenylcysteine carboxylmethyltransferase family protein [Terracidiphilus sp.]|jgi:protein-S-isoprenylcysteine O-methyltransferase Ste14
MNVIEQGHGSKARRKLLPPKMLLLSLLVQIPLVWWSWPLRPAEVHILTGVGMFAAGVVLNLSAERLFGKRGVGVCPFSPAPCVVSEGPYRFTRNPMYLGMALLSASCAMFTGVPWNLWAAAAFAVWLHFQFVLPEEEFLRNRLGVEYLLYASRTPRWLGLPGRRVARTGVPMAELCNRATDTPKCDL